MKRDQLDLFAATAPYQPHSAESKAAAREIEPHLGRLQAKILVLIQQTGVHGATDNELIERSGRGGSTVRPRRIELLKKGLIRKAVFTRATETGRQAAVWIAVRACSCPFPGVYRGSHCRAEKFGVPFASDDWCGCWCHRVEP